MGWYEQVVYDTGLREGFCIGLLTGVAIGVIAVLVIQRFWL